MVHVIWDTAGYMHIMTQEFSGSTDWEGQGWKNKITKNLLNYF